MMTQADDLRDQSKKIWIYQRLTYIVSLVLLIPLALSSVKWVSSHQFPILLLVVLMAVLIVSHWAGLLLVKRTRRIEQGLIIVGFSYLLTAILPSFYYPDYWVVAMFGVCFFLAEVFLSGQHRLFPWVAFISAICITAVFAIEFWVLRTNSQTLMGDQFLLSIILGFLLVAILIVPLIFFTARREDESNRINITTQQSILITLVAVVAVLTVIGFFYGVVISTRVWQGSELIALSRNMRLVSMAGALLVAGAILVSIAAGQGLTRSVHTIIANIKNMAHGDLDQKTMAEGPYELYTLMEAFNSLGSNLRQTLASLEERVTERTRILEYRLQQIQASAEVGRAAASILNTDDLIKQAVEAIRFRFGLYYVGLFLVDEAHEWAVLRAATGEAGKAMLARGHKIKVGEGMIGWTVANLKSRVARDIDEDTVRLSVSELPRTRSEVALPLISRGRVLGAISVQSEKGGVFDEATTTILQTMADQVAVALDNARLLHESQEAYETLRRSYGELSRKAWLESLRTQVLSGYHSDVGGVYPLRESRAVEDQLTAKGALKLPLKVRDQVLGDIIAQKEAGESDWSEEEITLMETLVDQLSVALENARLYEDSRLRAERERVLSEITSKVRSYTDVNMILQTAVQELAEALRVPKGAIRLRGLEFQRTSGAKPQAIPQTEPSTGNGNRGGGSSDE